MGAVRALYLPGADDLIGDEIRTASQTTTDPDGPPGSAAKGGEGPAPGGKDGSKTFVPPPPRTVLPNGYKGPIQGFVVGEGPIIIYESASDNVFNTPAPATGLYARADYLLWWTKGYHLPVLVTTAPPTVPQFFPGTAIPQAGTLTDPNTTVLFGGTHTRFNPASGGRFTLGWNFDPCGQCGVEASGFFLGRQSDNFLASSPQVPVLARPFFDVATGVQSRELTASPGTAPGDVASLAGSVAVHNFTDLWGAELNFRRLLCCDCNYTVYGFAGFRYLDLREGLTVTEDVTSLKAVPGTTFFNPGNRFIVVDSFQTRNNFYGGQVGLDGEIRRGRWSLMGRMQVGLGVTHETVDITGSQTLITPAGGVTTFNGGLLAVPSKAVGGVVVPGNIGTFSQDRFSVVPQVGLRIGYNITPNLRVYVGYDFLYWSSVLRPGDQVDTSINSFLIPNFNGPPSTINRPIVPMRTTGFYAHGINAGLEWRY
jgi:hypothetical protein